MQGVEQESTLSDEQFDKLTQVTISQTGLLHFLGPPPPPQRELFLSNFCIILPEPFHWFYNGEAQLKKPIGKYIFPSTVVVPRPGYSILFFDTNGVHELKNSYILEPRDFQISPTEPVTEAMLRWDTVKEKIKEYTHRDYDIFPPKSPMELDPRIFDWSKRDRLFPSFIRVPYSSLRVNAPTLPSIVDSNVPGSEYSAISGQHRPSSSSELSSGPLPLIPQTGPNDSTNRQVCPVRGPSAQSFSHSSATTGTLPAYSGYRETSQVSIPAPRLKGSLCDLAESQTRASTERFSNQVGTSVSFSTQSKGEVPSLRTLPNDSDDSRLHPLQHSEFSQSPETSTRLPGNSDRSGQSQSSTLSVRVHAKVGILGTAPKSAKVSKLTKNLVPRGRSGSSYRKMLKQSRGQLVCLNCNQPGHDQNHCEEKTRVFFAENVTIWQKIAFPRRKDSRLETHMWQMLMTM